MRIERFACLNWQYPAKRFIFGKFALQFIWRAPPFAALCSAPDREYVEAALIWHNDPKERAKRLA
jgi:hypothetical protein